MASSQKIQLINILLAFCISSPADAQDSNARPTPTFTLPSNYTIQSYNAFGAAVTFRPNTDFSDQALARLWQQVGPIATGQLSTTVLPTPEPSSYARPGALHPLVPHYDTSLLGKRFPDNFVWGVASSAYQVEGAAKDEGKGPSIWDLLAHRPPNTVSDNTTGDVLAEHYYLYKQDIARMKGLGIPAFSPSISWPRLFPFGKGPVNEAGLTHYDDVIAEMVAQGITPAVSLFHWDTPLALFEEYGAWTNEQIVDDYLRYAKLVIERYDEYVPIWFSFNEPQYCNWQYSHYPAGKYYPAYNNITGGLQARFLCGHYTLLAHAKLAKWYHGEFQGKGRITFKNSGNYFEANSTSEADAVAVQRSYDFVLGWFGGPWTDGDYPQTLKDTLGDLLPTFTEEEKALIKGSCDFFALDGYTSHYAYGISGGVEACANNRSARGYPECAGTRSTAPDNFPVGPSADNGVNWLYDTPAGIRKFLHKITKDLFPSIPDIQVTEFGFAEPFESKQPSLNEALWDLRRSDYYQGFLESILQSIVYDGVNCTGAWGWAIFDNFEWFSGLSVRFGLQYVNYTDLTRTPKASMFQFLNFFKEHGSQSSNSTMKLL